MSDATHIPEPSHPDSPESFLQKKVGGIPVWGLGLIFLGMLGAVYYYRKTKTPSVAGTGTVTPSFSTDSLTGQAPTAASLSGNGGATAAGYGGGTTLTTNEEWATMAANALIQQGQNPLAVQGALSKYLSGQSLTASEQSLVDQALSNSGTPPQGVQAAAPQDSPSINYTVVAGDSLQSIAQEFYGTTAKWSEIYQANVGVIGSDPAGLHHGETLVLPGDGLLQTPNVRFGGMNSSTLPTNHQYTVQQGDTGIQIADRFYGDPSVWDQIYALNRSKIANPDRLVSGTVLTLP